VVVVAGAGSAWRAWDQGVFSVGRGPAYEAWYRWRVLARGDTRDVRGDRRGFGMLIVRNAHDDAQRLCGGRAWQRLHLAATAHGLALQPLNQPTERADREQTLGITRTFGKAFTRASARPLRPLVSRPVGQSQ